MKTLFNLSVLLLVFGLYAFSVPEKTNEGDQKLLIHFTMEDDMVYMQCKKGCSWDKLEFDGSGEKTYSINQDGIRESTNELIRIRPGQEDFIFSVKKDDDGLAFIAHYGLNWKGLTANCNSLVGECVIKLNENGVQVSSF
ncbi:MAG: hypothetical protein EA362_13420 [Saprospirales bacterium]|nr:MAG: hypothetical protein EA362_13420 [Saprospirales bacterium]